MSTVQVKTISNLNGTEGIKILDNGEVTFSNQPKFLARGCSNTGAGGRVLLFNQTIDYNVGSYYNSSTGRFTAPITGIYMINFTAFFTGNTGRDLSIILINGSGIQEYTQEQPTPSAGQGYATCRGSMIYRLSTNDYVTIFGEGALAGSNSIYSTFSCCLVC